MKAYRFHREADTEFTEALAHYAGIALDLGSRFYDEIEVAITDVRAHPLRFREIDPPVRRRLIPSFPYAVLYIDEPDQVWIIAIAPLKRDPNYWRQRVAA